MGLFIRKCITALQAKAQATGSKTLKCVLGPVSLSALGVCVMASDGLFPTAGAVAPEHTASGITLMPEYIISFIAASTLPARYAPHQKGMKDRRT